MKDNIQTLLFIAVILLASCEWFTDDITEQEPAYTAKIAWDSGLKVNSTDSHMIDGEYIYFYERPSGYTTNGVCALTKIEAETGNFVWRSRVFYSVRFCQPVAVGQYIYVFLDPNGIYSFSKETGELTATIKIVDTGGNDVQVLWSTTGYQNYIYFDAYSSSFSSLVRLDVNAIDRNEDPETPQAITPDILWSATTIQSIVYANPVIYNNIAYTGTSSGYVDLELVGINTDTKEPVFYQRFGIDDDGTVYDRGTQPNPIFIHDKVLYYLGWSVAAYSLTTQELLWRHAFYIDTPDRENYGGYTYQAVYHKGRVYYTSGASESGADYRNIHCIDARTGKLVWNAISKHSESLETNPIIAHDRLYVAQGSGLWVYDPENGKLIGVDKSFYGMGMGRNLVYNDYMICIRMDRDGSGTGNLVAVYVGE
jgi:hypothetical protein